MPGRSSEGDVDGPEGSGSPPDANVEHIEGLDGGNLVSTEELREYFECPICYEVPRSPPIFSCPQGHMLCGKCRPRLTACPICRVNLPRQAENRLYFAERLLEERVPLPCKYEEHGCPVELVSNLIRRHEEDGCPYEPLACENADLGCTAQIPRKAVQEHAEKCEFIPASCFLPSCQEKVSKKMLLHHMQGQHLSIFSGGCLDAKVLLCLLLIIISLLINLVFFYDYYSNSY